MVEGLREIQCVIQARVVAESGSRTFERSRSSFGWAHGPILRSKMTSTAGFLKTTREKKWRFLCQSG